MIDLSSFTFEIITLQNKIVIKVLFQYHPDLVLQLKKIISARYYYKEKFWYFPDTNYHRNKFGLPEKCVGKNAIALVHPVNKAAFLALVERLKLKSYSPNTIKTYTVEFAQLLYLIKNYPVDKLTYDKIKDYLLYCIEKLHLSESQLHSRINALKFYFEQVLGREKFLYELPRPKKQLLLPKVLNEEEVKRLFRETTNLKHCIILKLCYGMGLRVSEIIKLKIEHIDSKRLQVLIFSAKGKKDRYVNLPVSILADLRTYYKIYKPKIFLFEGQYGSEYSIRSAQNVFKASLKKARIIKNVGIHSLRHSYATHLLEKGTEISLIQKLLGHNDIKTTLLYTHISNKNISKVKSPLDLL